MLRDINDLSTHETAEVLSLTDTAVKTRLSRARLRLREELSTYFGIKTDELREKQADKAAKSNQSEPKEHAPSL